MSRPPCFNCGAQSDHDHHVVPRSLGGTATVPLCGECHGKAHGHRGLRTLRELTRLALTEKRARCELVGTPPYGFTADVHGRLVVEPSEQATIRRACELQQKGLSVRKIAAALDAEGCRSRNGQPHSSTAVYRMLRPRETVAHPAYRPVRVELADFGPLFHEGAR